MNENITYMSSHIEHIVDMEKILTESLAYRSDWWRMNFFVLFLTIFGLYAGRIVILIPGFQRKTTNAKY